MRHNTSITTILLVFILHLFGQLDVKHDHIWLLGYDSNPTDSLFGGTVIDFNHDPPEFFYQFRDLNFNITNASICNEEGELQFYTNNISIQHAAHQTMINREGLNPGEYTDEHEEYSYYITQGAIALPMPENPDLYFLFHGNYNYPTDEFTWHSSKFYY